MTENKNKQLFAQGMEEIKEKYKGEIPENIKDLFFLDFHHNLIVFTDISRITDYPANYKIDMIKLFEKIYGYRNIH